MPRKICIDRESSEGQYDSIRSITRTYNLYEFPSRVDAEISLVQSPTCPVRDPNWPQLVRTPFQVEETDTPGYYTASVTWEFGKQGGANDPPNEANDVFSGGVSLQTMRIENTLEHISTSVSPDWTVEWDDGGGLIGRKWPTGVDGTDTTYPSLNFSLTRNYPKNTFNVGWLASAMPFVGQPNITPWRGFGIWEVMITGIDGTNDGGEDWDVITFNFEARPTFEDIEIKTPTDNYPDKKIIVPRVRGFEYLWVETVPKKVGGRMRDVIRAAHVDRIHFGCELNSFL